MVIDGEVDGGLEGHGLQGGVDGVGLVQRRAEHPPGDDGPVVWKEVGESEGTGLTCKRKVASLPSFSRAVLHCARKAGEWSLGTRLSERMISSRQ